MACEKIREARKFARRGRRYDPPFALDIVLACIRSLAHDPEIANFGILRCRDLPLRVIGTLERPFHVGLTRADPYVADENVGQPDRVLAIDRKIVRSPRFSGFQVDVPAAVGRGDGNRRLPAKVNADGFAGVGPAPDVNRHVTLNYHVVAEQRRDPHIGPKVGGQGSTEKYGQKQSHRTPIILFGETPFYPTFFASVCGGRTGATVNL